MNGLPNINGHREENLANELALISMFNVSVHIPQMEVRKIFPYIHGR